MLQIMQSFMACKYNMVNVENLCRQLIKDNVGIYYVQSDVKIYIMCNINYLLFQQTCKQVIKRDPNVNQVGNIYYFVSLTSNVTFCSACISGLVLDYTSQKCVVQKEIQFTQITCNGYITVSSDLAGNLFDQISLCSLSSDSLVTSNSTINFETTVPVSQSTAIGLFSLTSVFSNVLVKGELTVKQSKSSSQVFIGTLTGLMNQNTFIQNCSINIVLKLDSASASTVFKSGGLVGMIQGKYLLRVQNCSVQLQVEGNNQADNILKSWYCVSGGIVGHLHLVPTLQIDNTNTTLNILTTRSAGGFLGLLQGGIVLITNSLSKGTLKAFACGGMLGEAGAPGLTPTQTQQVTLDSVRSELLLTGTKLGAVIGQGCQMTMIRFAGTNSFYSNGICFAGSSNGLSFAGVPGC
ncbi:Hypothetical_protein [Hexamita inflata]|uniref:Hypothetical_protein n=1 Tax=Hexamita inflata TaxID=28002 RepID=A0AA86NN42_9EUKA|nr:Hypothetical protein HINF_LOCUS9671 [Hexamita inflata]